MALPFKTKTQVVSSAATWPDLSDRDKGAEISTSVMITRRDDVPLAVLYDYWVNIHGVLAARSEGAAGYWQHRLGDPLTGFFQPINGIDETAPEGDPIVGLAEITFATLEDRNTLIGSAAVGQMIMDEQNAIKGTYMYSTGPGNAFTVVDRLLTNTMLGKSEEYRVLVFLRQSMQVSTDQFRKYVRDDLGNYLAASPGMLKVRVHLVEAYDEHAWPTPNVDHKRSAEQQFQAYVELAFENEEAAEQFRHSGDFHRVSEAFARHIAGATTYPVPETYTLVYAGRPTGAGLRGLSVFNTLHAVGEPKNQRALPLLKILFGEGISEPAL